VALRPSPPPQPATHRKTDKERHPANGGGGGGGVRAESYDSKQAWSSINRSILSDGYISGCGRMKKTLQWAEFWGGCIVRLMLTALVD